MNRYNPEKFTWGYEVEWGDIDRKLVIPERLGKWEYAETDIVNEREPYRGVACDPLGLEPPMGGEINMCPTATWQEQVGRIFELKWFFEDAGCPPTSSCVNHGHLHCYVPGLKDDVDALKRLITYIRDNQHLTIEKLYGYRVHPDMAMTKTAKTYLKFDGGRPMPDYMCNNIIKLTTDFDHFIKLHAAGKDGVSMGRPFRYAINTYCMKHTGTIEFRCFRSTTKLKELYNQFKFVELFINAALNDGPDVQTILLENEFQFPEFNYEHDLYLGWEKTKWDKSRGKKQREYLEVQ